VHEGGAGHKTDAYGLYNKVITRKSLNQAFYTPAENCSGFYCDFKSKHGAAGVHACMLFSPKSSLATRDYILSAVYADQLFCDSNYKVEYINAKNCEGIYT